MSTTTVTSGMKSRLRMVINHKLQKVGGRLAAELLDSILLNTPREDGHAHEAWMTAGEQLSGQLLNGKKAVLDVVNKYRQQDAGSNDPTAKRHGVGTADFINEANGQELHIKLQNKLGFVRKLERGGTIGTIAPHGKKAGGASTRGVLFAERLAEGRGLVRWVDEAGNVRLAPSRDIKKPGRYVRTAIRTTEFVAKRLGGKTKRLK